MKRKELIEKFIEIYGDKYDYSKVGEIKSTSEKISIVCPVHGEFIKTVNNHLHGQGCPKCKKEEKILEGKEKMIKTGAIIHNNKYDYSKVEYINSHTKVCIICPEHGEFWQTPSSHLNGCGCPKCANKNKNLDEVIKHCKEVHKDKYDYSLITTPNLSQKQKIICKKCGNVFEMTLCNHIYQKQGCKFCTHRSYAYTNDEFIRRAKEIHGDKYDYSKVDYKNKSTKVCIICPEHGEFWQTPDKHINGKQGCPKCSAYHKMDTNEFIQKAKNIHGERFDYSKTVYKNNNTKVCIICPEHGEFWQTPHGHLNGRGCFKCREESNVNETLLFNFLTENYEGEIIGQYKDAWLEGQTLDIYIPSKRIGIEYQGIQHFKPIKFFGGVKKYEYTKEKDKEKYEKCKMNGVKLFYFSKEKNLPNDYLDTIYKDENELLNEIKKHADY